jgi:TctA family transporter
MSQGDFSIFFTRSISAGCLILSVLISFSAIFFSKYRRIIPLR